LSDLICMILHPAQHCQVVTVTARQRNNEYDTNSRPTQRLFSDRVPSTTAWQYYNKQFAVVPYFQRVDRLRKTTINFRTSQIQKDSRQSTTMLGPPRSAAMKAVVGHTAARLLIKPSPTDMLITGGARNITLPGHIRPTRLPTAGGNRPNHRDSPHLEQHEHVLKTRVSAESIVTMHCWILKWKLNNSIKWGIAVRFLTRVRGFLFGSGAQPASFSIIAESIFPGGKVAAVWSTQLTSILWPG